LYQTDIGFNISNKGVVVAVIAW